MDSEGRKMKLQRLGRIILSVAITGCVLFATLSTHQLNKSIDMGNRQMALNYGNLIGVRVYDLFERVDTGLKNLSLQAQSEENISAETLKSHLDFHSETWSLDGTGIMYEDGENFLSDGSRVVFDNEISLRDVLSYSQSLNITRQSIGGEDMLVFAKPCQIQVEGRAVVGIFSALKMTELEALLGEYGEDGGSLITLTHSDGTNIWKQGREGEDMGNCYEELAALTVARGDSVEQMKNRMAVAMNGTVNYVYDGQSYYMAYVPLGVNYWYLLISVRSDAIDFTELSRSHFLISALLVGALLLTGAVSTIYFVQRNRNLSRYNKQLRVATEMASEAHRANQANKAKQEFLTSVSHDIRTPLNGVIGMMALAKEEYDDKEKCFDRLDKATLSAHYLLGLLTDILDMSQIESGKLKIVNEDVDMRSLIYEVESILETSVAEKGLALRLDDRLHNRYFRGDRLRIKQILINLGSNAVKYTPKGGEVVFTVSEEQREGASLVTFKVSDNGEGIPPEKLDAIFLPFEQASLQRQKGVGLGLSIVSSLVSLMGGEKSVESTVGKGSTFTVTLPLEPVNQPTPPTEKKPDGDLKGISLLLAEDNTINAEIAATLLQRRGASVTLVKDGREALDAFTASAPGDFSAILMDIQMPVMDGIAATKAIRALDRPDAEAIPIFSMTANAFREQKEEMLAAGMNDFLCKPINIDDICHCIRSWTERN